MRTAILSVIVRVVLPDYPALETAARRSVENDVARYVAALLGSMPAFLRFPYTVALCAFEWLALLRHGRRFRNLTVAQQTLHLAAWSEAPLLPMRDFVRLIRSSALLAYFDHQLVARQLEAERRRETAPAESATAAGV